MRNMRITSALVLFLLGLLGLGRDAGAGLLTASQRELLASRPQIVGSGVISGLDSAPRVRVLIAFRVPDPPHGASSEQAKAARRTVVGKLADSLLESLPSGEFRVLRRFASVNAFAGEITADGVQRLIEDQRILRIDLDEGGVGHLNQARPLSKIDVLNALGLTGEGVTVAVLDSGVDTDHPDLQDDLVAQQCFCTGCCPGGGDTQSGPGSAEDDNGHGTNVSGIVTSKGTVAPVGASPDASLVAIKVLDSFNSFCCASDVIAGLDWILDSRPDVDVVNMSLGTFSLFSGNCDGAASFTLAFASVIDSLRAAGVLVFASSGNQASSTQMAAPACVTNTISVGAVYDGNVGSVTFGCTDSTTQADKPTCFTNSNSTTDVFAPGAFTTSTGLSGGTSSYLGTSQASPLVAGCAADLREAHPGTPPSDLEIALETSPATVTKGGVNFPRLDCQAARNALADEFYSITPCRVLDTRNPNGPYGGPALTSGGERSFTIQGACGIPASARAVSVNLTAIFPTGAGELKLYPGDLSTPTSSTISFIPGRVRANNAILVLAKDGTVAVLPFVSGGGQVHITLDVNGYFQ